MYSGRLEININDYEVTFYGIMSIEEAFDYLNYYDKKGFSKVEIGSENSCLRLTKQKEDPQDFKASCDEKEESNNYMSLIIDKLKRENYNLKSLIKNIFQGHVKIEQGIIDDLEKTDPI